MSHTSCRTLKSLILNYKPDVPPFDLVGTVYKIPCSSCNCSYIGQTGQKLGDRISQHKKAILNHDSNSKLYQHALNFDHFPNFNNFEILVRNCNSKSKRLFFEAYFTKITPDSINDCICIPSEYTLFV